tara:strand:+ start:3290 stop:3937 length:648 start_codon:yes stop_codon:yes gene_type:complete
LEKINMKIFVPIKENSQRVKNKNFREINSETLYERLIQKFSNYEIYIDTDSERVFQETLVYDNVTPYYRDKNLIGDEVSVCDLISNFIKKFNISGNVCQLHVTSPFIQAKTIDNATMILNNGYDSIVSCNTIQSRFWKKEEYGYCPVNHNPIKLEQTQDLPELYEENSCFYMFDAENFLKTSNRIGKNPFFYDVSFPENIDIDTETDWKLVEELS